MTTSESGECFSAGRSACSCAEMRQAGVEVASEVPGYDRLDGRIGP